ncbi:unnamed protein product, partial [Rotaria sp. Silwood2]
MVFRFLKLFCITLATTTVYSPGSQCASQPCQHGAHCFDVTSANTYYCDCRGSYTGTNCQTQEGICRSDLCSDKTSFSRPIY